MQTSVQASVRSHETYNNGAKPVIRLLSNGAFNFRQVHHNNSSSPPSSSKSNNMSRVYHDQNDCDSYYVGITPQKSNANFRQHRQQRPLSNRAPLEYNNSTHIVSGLNGAAAQAVGATANNSLNQLQGNRRPRTPRSIFAAAPEATTTTSSTHVERNQHINNYDMKNKCASAGGDLDCCPSSNRNGNTLRHQSPIMCLNLIDGNGKISSSSDNNNNTTHNISERQQRVCVAEPRETNDALSLYNKITTSPKLTKKTLHLVRNEKFTATNSNIAISNDPTMEEPSTTTIRYSSRDFAEQYNEEVESQKLERNDSFRSVNSNLGEAQKLESLLTHRQEEEEQQSSSSSMSSLSSSITTSSAASSSKSILSDNVLLHNNNQSFSPSSNFSDGTTATTSGNVSANTTWNNTNDFAGLEKPDYISETDFAAAVRNSSKKSSAKKSSSHTKLILPHRQTTAVEAAKHDKLNPHRSDKRKRPNKHINGGVPATNDNDSAFSVVDDADVNNTNNTESGLSLLHRATSSTSTTATYVSQQAVGWLAATDTTQQKIQLQEPKFNLVAAPANHQQNHNNVSSVNNNERPIDVPVEWQLRLPPSTTSAKDLIPPVRKPAIADVLHTQSAMQPTISSLEPVSTLSESMEPSDAADNSRNNSRRQQFSTSNTQSSTATSMTSSYHTAVGKKLCENGKNNRPTAIPPYDCGHAYCVICPASPKNSLPSSVQSSLPVQNGAKTLIGNSPPVFSSFNSKFFVNEKHPATKRVASVGANRPHNRPKLTLAPETQAQHIIPKSNVSTTIQHHPNYYHHVFSPREHQQQQHQRTRSSTNVFADINKNDYGQRAVLVNDGDCNRQFYNLNSASSNINTNAPPSTTQLRNNEVDQISRNNRTLSLTRPTTPPSQQLPMSLVGNNHAAVIDYAQQQRQDSSTIQSASPQQNLQQTSSNNDGQINQNFSMQPNFTGQQNERCTIARKSSQPMQRDDDDDDERYDKVDDYDATSARGRRRELNDVKVVDGGDNVNDENEEAHKQSTTTNSSNEQPQRIINPAKTTQSADRNDDPKTASEEVARVISADTVISEINRNDISAAKSINNENAANAHSSVQAEKAINVMSNADTAATASGTCEQQKTMSLPVTSLTLKAELQQTHSSSGSLLSEGREANSKNSCLTSDRNDSFTSLQNAVSSDQQQIIKSISNGSEVWLPHSSDGGKITTVDSNSQLSSNWSDKNNFSHSSLAQALSTNNSSKMRLLRADQQAAPNHDTPKQPNQHTKPMIRTPLSSTSGKKPRLLSRVGNMLRAFTTHNSSSTTTQANDAATAVVTPPASSSLKSNGSSKSLRIQTRTTSVNVKSIQPNHSPPSPTGGVSDSSSLSYRPAAPPRQMGRPNTAHSQNNQRREKPRRSASGDHNDYCYTAATDSQCKSSTTSSNKLTVASGTPTKLQTYFNGIYDDNSVPCPASPLVYNPPSCRNSLNNSSNIQHLSCAAASGSGGCASYNARQAVAEAFRRHQQLQTPPIELPPPTPLPSCYTNSQVVYFPHQYEPLTDAQRLEQQRLFYYPRLRQQQQQHQQQSPAPQPPPMLTAMRSYQALHQLANNNNAREEDYYANYVAPSVSKPSPPHPNSPTIHFHQPASMVNNNSPYQQPTLVTAKKCNALRHIENYLLTRQQQQPQTSAAPNNMASNCQVCSHNSSSNSQYLSPLSSPIKHKSNQHVDSNLIYDKIQNVNASPSSKNPNNNAAVVSPHSHPFVRSSSMHRSASYYLALQQEATAASARVGANFSNAHNNGNINSTSGNPTTNAIGFSQAHAAASPRKTQTVLPSHDRFRSNSVGRVTGNATALAVAEFSEQYDVAALSSNKNRSVLPAQQPGIRSGMPFNLKSVNNPDKNINAPLRNTNFLATEALGLVQPTENKQVSNFDKNLSTKNLCASGADTADKTAKPGDENLSGRIIIATEVLDTKGAAQQRGVHATSSPPNVAGRLPENLLSSKTITVPSSLSSSSSMPLQNKQASPQRYIDDDEEEVSENFDKFLTATAAPVENEKETDSKMNSNENEAQRPNRAVKPKILPLAAQHASAVGYSNASRNAVGSSGRYFYRQRPESGYFSEAVTATNCSSTAITPLLATSASSTLPTTVSTTKSFPDVVSAVLPEAPDSKELTAAQCMSTQTDESYPANHYLLPTWLCEELKHRLQIKDATTNPIVSKSSQQHLKKLRQMPLKYQQRSFSLSTASTPTPSTTTTTTPSTVPTSEYAGSESNNSSGGDVLPTSSRTSSSNSGTDAHSQQTKRPPATANDFTHSTLANGHANYCTWSSLDSAGGSNRSTAYNSNCGPTGNILHGPKLEINTNDIPDSILDDPALRNNSFLIDEEQNSNQKLCKSSEFSFVI